jgi:hypothetical protein
LFAQRSLEISEIGARVHDDDDEDGSNSGSAVLNGESLPVELYILEGADRRKKSKEKRDGRLTMQTFLKDEDFGVSEKSTNTQQLSVNTGKDFRIHKFNKLSYDRYHSHHL